MELTPEQEDELRVMVKVLEKADEFAERDAVWLLSGLGIEAPTAEQRSLIISFRNQMWNVAAGTMYQTVKVSP